MRRPDTIIILDDSDDEQQPIGVSVASLRGSDGASSSSSASTTPSSTKSASSSGDSDDVLPALSRRSDASSRAKARRRARRQQQIQATRRRRTAVTKAAAARPKNVRVARRQQGVEECALCETGAGRPELAHLQFLTEHRNDAGDVEVTETAVAFNAELVGPEEHRVASAYMHRSCMEWAPAMYQDKRTEKWKGVETELKRSDHSICKCFICGSLGGVTGCGYRPCKRTAHFPCLLAITKPEDKWFFDTQIFAAFCPDHKPEDTAVAQVVSVPLAQPPAIKHLALSALADLAVASAEDKKEDTESDDDDDDEPVDKHWDRWQQLLKEEEDKFTDETPVPKSYHGYRQHYPQVAALARWEQEQPEPVSDWDRYNRDRIHGFPKRAQKCPVVRNYSSEEEEESEADDDTKSQGAEPDEPTEAVETAEASETEEPAEEQAAEPMEEVEQETPEQKAAAEAYQQQLLADPSVPPHIKQVIGEDMISTLRDDDADAMAAEFASAMRMETQPATPNSPVWDD